MKKLLVALLCLFVFPCLSFADKITLNDSEVLAVPAAKRMVNWEIIKVNVEEKHMCIRYRWATEDGVVIQEVGGERGGWQYWDCQNIEVPGTNAECLAAGDPYECCTGAGTGTCDDMLDTCFSDVFGFIIRAQDVGTQIGVGLRQLIWNQMKNDTLTPGNDGTFE